MATRYSLVLKNLVLVTALIWFAAGCNSNSATTASGTGAAAVRLDWNGTDRASLQKNTAKAPAGVAVVRLMVSGDGMTDIREDFEAAKGSGRVNGIPAGAGRTLKAQGLDRDGIVIYEGAISNITVAAGQVTDVGIINMEIVNAAPRADAGRPQSVLTGSVVTLDGGGSSDPNRDLLTYSWAFTSRPDGSGSFLSSTVAPNPTFTPDLAGRYVLELTVNDGKLNSAAASVTVTASAPETNAAPVADAGRAQNVITGSVVTLDGSASSDANGDLLTYRWAFTSRPDGSLSALSNTVDVKPTFSPDVAGSYVMGLIVNDGTTDSAPASVTITASAAGANAAPVANAGVAQNVLVGTLVTLDGSNSSDANGDPLSFSWALTSRPSGSGVTLSNPSDPHPSFTPDVAGAYVFNLVVNDGKASSAQAPVTVTAYAPDANVAPVAHAGTDQVVIVGATVTLDGSGSSDANGDPLTYRWGITSRPAGSNASLSSTAAAKPSFNADAVGTFVFSLTVNDGKTDSAVSTVSVSSIANSGTVSITW